jgi:hypothetical protein
MAMKKTEETRRLPSVSLWQASSVMWILLVATIAYEKEDVVVHKPDTITVRWGTSLLTYPITATAEQIRNDLTSQADQRHEDDEKRFQSMTEAQKDQCSKFTTKTPFSQMPDYCVNYFTHDIGYAIPHGWEQSLNPPPATPPEPQYTNRIIPLLIIPPICFWLLECIARLIRRLFRKNFRQ